MILGKKNPTNSFRIKPVYCAAPAYKSDKIQEVLGKQKGMQGTGE